MAAKKTEERVVKIRVWGREFSITLRRLDDGKTYWSTHDAHWSHLSGICRSDRAAVADARDWLQCRRQPADGGDVETSDTSTDDDIALLLAEGA